MEKRFPQRLPLTIAGKAEAGQAGGLGAAPPVIRPGGVVAHHAETVLTRKKPLRRRRKGAFFPSHGPRKRL